MFQSQKHVFWQALVLTISVFLIGIFIGIWIENSKVSKISDLYSASELKLLDARIFGDLLSSEAIDSKDCDEMIGQNIEFGNSIYEEAKLLDKYEETNKITEKVKQVHKEYDILRTLFWLNSLEIKKACNSTFSTVVYFYQYNEPSIEKRVEQKIFSRILGEIKNEKGNSVILIPIAGDNNFSSVDIMMKNYKIDSLPTILINEKIKITSLKNKEEIKRYLD